MMKSHKSTRNASRKRIFGIVAVVLLVVAVIGCGVYVSDYYHADRAAQEAMNTSVPVSASDVQAVQVSETDFGLTFLPEDPKRGLIFYPGGKVEETAYAPLMREAAENGTLCVLLKMPLRLAVLDVNAADGVQAAYPAVQTWYIGGHSLGGSMAASYAAKHPDLFQGLILLAAYSTEDLRDSGLSVLSVYGSEDGVLNRKKYDVYRENLPENTSEVVLDGGNHAGFGSYGEQDGDGKAKITQEMQRKLTADAMQKLWAK